MIVNWAPKQIHAWEHKLHCFIPPCELDIFTCLRNDKKQVFTMALNFTGLLKGTHETCAELEWNFHELHAKPDALCEYVSAHKQYHGC